jgi:hypothetical protein
MIRRFASQACVVTGLPADRPAAGRVAAAGRWLAALAVLLALAGPARAHGLLMKLRAEGSAIVGEVYYSSGRKAVGEWIEVQDLGQPDASLRTLQTDATGEFRVTGEAGRSYRVTARGEEGHSVTMDLSLAPEARPTLVEDPGEAPQETGWRPPAFAIIGGLLILSIIPALLLRRRSAAGRRAAAPDPGPEARP